MKRFAPPVILLAILAAQYAHAQSDPGPMSSTDGQYQYTPNPSADAGTLQTPEGPVTAYPDGAGGFTATNRMAPPTNIPPMVQTAAN